MERGCSFIWLVVYIISVCVCASLSYADVPIASPVTLCQATTAE